MASAYKKGNTYYLRFKDFAGRWRSQASKAKTKTEAKRLAHDLEARSERERLGLAPIMQKDGGGPFSELLTWWLDNCSEGKPSHKTNRSAIEKHLLPSALAPLPLTAVTKERIEAFLRLKERDLKPQTLNHLRGYISRTFSEAIAVGKFQGANPASHVEKRAVTRGKIDYLREHEVMPVLNAVPPHWRPVFATAIYAGLRKGELAGLQKADVDLAKRLLTVAHSYDRNTTKGMHVDTVPINEELVPYLAAAIDSSPTTCKLVFPGPEDEMRSRGSPVEKVLRRALARAGIVEGYQHVCRYKGCEHQEVAADNDLRRCPVHDHKLWPKALVRPIRFHDLRHTTASLLMMRGADLVAVQRIMRHRDPKTTTEIYGHLAPGYLSSEANKLTFNPPQPDKHDDDLDLAVGCESQPFATRLLPYPNEQHSGAVEIDENGLSDGFYLERATRVELATFSLGSQGPDRPDLSNRSQPVGIVLDRDGHPVQPLQASSKVSRNFATRLLPGRPHPRTIAAAPVRMLTVAEVATHLRVSTATVYRLCDRGTLRHTRIRNSIRVSTEALEELTNNGQKWGGAS